MTFIQKTYCCRLNGANNKKREELKELFSSARSVSKWIFNNRFFFDEKDFYKAVREENPLFPSKPTQKIIERYKANKDIFSLREQIEPNLLFDNQMFDIQFEEGKYFNAFLRISSTNKGHRMKLPLSGLWPIRKLKEAKKIDQVTIKKHSNGSLYAHITASFECSEPKSRSNKGIGIDLNHKNITLSNNKFYSLKQLVHHKDEARKNKSAKKNEKQFTKDFIHKATTKIIRDLRDKDIEVLFLEDLSHIRNKSSKKKGTSKGKKLNARSNSFPFSMIRSQLSYKALEKGMRVIARKEQTVNSSKECSKCGSIDTLRPTRSSFQCLSCGFSLHADLNAARNIERKGIEFERARALLNALKSEMALHAAENQNAEVPTP